MTTEPKGEEKGAALHVAYAEHLITLIQQARKHLAKGEDVPESLWAKIDTAMNKMVEAMPQ